MSNWQPWKTPYGQVAGYVKNKTNQNKRHGSINKGVLISTTEGPHGCASYARADKNGNQNEIELTAAHELFERHLKGTTRSSVVWRLRRCTARQTYGNT